MTTESAAPALFKPASLAPRVVPATPLLAALPLDQPQAEKALSALLAHVAKVQQQREATDLLGEQDEKVFLVVGLKRAANREQHMPIRLPLAHPVIDPKQSPVTLFVKDPQRTYKDLLETSKIGFVHRVVGLDKLRNKHKTFEAKRLLLKQAELFLVDDRVVGEVGKAIGKTWREAKKQPVPVSLARKDLKGELERAVASTYLQINTGTSLSIKFGTTSLHTPAQLLANLFSLIPQLAVVLPHGGFENVQSLHIKTSTSISLPIYTVSLTEGRFTGPSEGELKAIEGKKEGKAEKVREKEEKLALRESRRVEREAEKEKREKRAKEEKEEKKVAKREKRKAEKEAEREDDVEVEVDVVEEVVAPIVKKSKKAKKDVVVEEVVEMEVEQVVTKKEKKSKKVVAPVVEVVETVTKVVKEKKAKKVKA